MHNSLHALFPSILYSKVFGYPRIRNHPNFSYRADPNLQRVHDVSGFDAREYRIEMWTPFQTHVQTENVDHARARVSCELHFSAGCL